MSGADTLRLMGLIVLLGGAPMLSGGAAAQPYPAKPVRIIVPASPGGGMDILARAIGPRLTESWGQPVVIDNRPGATGSIGAEAVARAAPDGYTLLVSTSAMLTINPNLNLRLPYDPVRDFAPVTLAATSPFVLVVHPSLPARTVQELIALARARPGQLNYSSAGIGSATHLAGELFSHMARIRMVHVPYKGGAPAITDLLAGHIQTRFSSLLPILPHVKAGKLRPLAVSSPAPSALFPGLPPMAQTLPGYEAGIWYGVLAPAATPAGLVGRLNADIVRQLHSTEAKARLAADGSEAVGNSAAEFAMIVRADLQRWAKVIKEVGVRAE